MLGKARWLRHQDIVARYWETIRSHLNGMDVHGLVIYQDGLMADGDLGRRIVEAVAGKGSPNHQIILNLMERGARIRKTEDVELLKKEFDRILQLVAMSPEVDDRIGTQYRIAGKELLVKRDRFIAKTINQTLLEGEKGVLFIGAFHNVVEKLENDIQVDELRNQRTVRAYFEALIGKDQEAFEQLASYMVSGNTAL